jgi:hypothetical protein
MPEAADTSTHTNPELPSIRDTQRPRKPHDAVAPINPDTTNSNTQNAGLIRRIRAALSNTGGGLREGFGSLDVRDKRIAVEDITDQRIAEIVGRTTNGDNPFDVRSIMADLGFYGDSSGNPNQQRAESAVRSRLYSLREQGAIDAATLENPNLHDQRVVFRVTPQMRPLLEKIANPPKTSQ